MSFVDKVAEKEDVKGIVDVHMMCFSREELSIRLGVKFIRVFYDLAASDEEVSLKVVKDSKGKVIAFSVAFYNYRSFIRKFQKCTLPQKIEYLFKQVCGLKFKKIIDDVLMVKDAPISKVPIGVQNFHLGNIAVLPEYRTNPLALIKFKKIFSEHADSFVQKECSGFWTSVRSENSSSIRWIENVAKPKERKRVQFGKTEIDIFWRLV